MKPGDSELLEKRADGGSIPFFQSGGAITQSGPIYAHKGEVVIPKGGIQESPAATASLKDNTIKLEDDGLADKIADKIKEAIESSEIKIEEDAVVKVDVTDVSVPVDVGDAMVKVDTDNVTVKIDSEGVTIPVDVGTAASTIGSTITEALAKATVDVNVKSTETGGVGADSINLLSTAIESVDDRLLAVKDNLETQLVSIKSEIGSTIQTNIAAQVEAAMTRIQQDVNEHTNKLSHVNSQIKSFEHQTDHRLREVDRVARDAQNLAQRPPTHVPSY